MKPAFVLIDGYNLLGALGLWSRVGSPTGEAVREELVSSLGRYAQRRDCRVTVVFDAWRQKGQLRKLEHRAGVTVVYSETGEKADQVIQELVRSCGKEVAVVSSDHEVVAVAKANGALTLRAEEFANRLNELCRPSRSIPLSQGMKKDEEVVAGRSKDKKGNPRKLPKKVRQRNRIMKKF